MRWMLACSLALMVVAWPVAGGGWDDHLPMPLVYSWPAPPELMPDLLPTVVVAEATELQPDAQLVAAADDAHPRGFDLAHWRPRTE